MLAVNRLMSLCLVFLLFQDHLQIPMAVAEATKHVHIVYMGEKQHNDPNIVEESHHQLLSHVLGSKEAARRSIIYSYKHGFSGFAAALTKSEAEEIADSPGVVQVIPSRVRKLHTTRSWDFLGLEPYVPQRGLLAKGRMGEGIIIGLLDSGVWPESRSFSDEGMGSVPSRWKGICQPGEKFKPSNCNRKIIGARWYREAYQAEHPGIFSGNRTEITNFKSARDGDGHGTHTASTAAGNFVENANYTGLAEGLARGGAPRAHLAIYKVCWGPGCSDADILKAFDTAIHDGVDILSVSLGGEVPLSSYVDQGDSVAIGSFHAVAHGITVVASAGNEGPSSETVVNVAPWLITVGASTIDRRFLAAVTLGNKHTLLGESIGALKDLPGFHGITYSEDIVVDSTNASVIEECDFGSLNATLAAGKIVLCFEAVHDIGSTSEAVAEAGAVGLIYAHSRDDGLRPCDIPCVKVDYEIGSQILSYIRRARSPIAKLGKPRSLVGRWTSPIVAKFSSRGPSSISPQVLKPDIAAPGVDILAAYQSSDKDSLGYGLLSGTSMSCPHVAGIAALIKSVHPNWSPAAIRSALVTTASQTGTDGTGIREGGPTDKIADPFDVGGGHVDPNRAMDPGLVYDASTDDYIQFLCSIGYGAGSISNLTGTKIRCKKDGHKGLNLNLPSIVIPDLQRRLTVTRTVTNVGHKRSVYKAIVRPPHGTSMKVEPRVLRFNPTKRALSFKVSFAPQAGNVRGGYRFGSLTWTDGKHYVRIPVAARILEYGTTYAYV